ncbi:hypothetical protein AMK26_07540 [Streptomyces sp. CB03234]|uniref:hypothetical protein n=1 Tax=Streptomyces sp. (strain CB03234) TaxID=1703937 RepID=UPI0009396B75|nr:hypothetical protein [Streptomyces sp. CB03234]OKK05941.1 hypothetical protein AMK26_07540 [Streptomyces sp. CB03234]
MSGAAGPRNEDGSVTYPAGGEEVDGEVPEGGSVHAKSDALYRQAANIHPNPDYGRALGYANRIADALKEATGVVREAGKSCLDSLPEPPKDGSPKDDASWWRVRRSSGSEGR